MTTTTRQTKQARITRQIELSDSLNGLVLAVVTEVHNGGQKITCDLYWLRRQPSDFGVAFTCEKAQDGASYDVLLNAPGGGHSCDCKWSSYRGHLKPCRHIEACLQAVRERKL
jgi:hypothetical protein